MKKNLCIFNARLVDKVLDCKGLVVISEGKILSVMQGNFNQEQASKIAVDICNQKEEDIDFFDACGLVLQPSFIDMHAHFRYPGQSAKEDLNSGLNSAVAGGFGTLVLMPNTQPVVSSLQDATQICKEVESFGLADVYQTVSLTKGFDGKDTTHLDELNIYSSGASALDGYIPVVTEDGRDVASADIMLEAMKKCASKNIIVSCHSEDSTLASSAGVFRRRGLEQLASKDNEAAYISFEKANELLVLAEDIATERNINLANAAKCAVHIAHVSTIGSINAVRRAKKAGQRVTCEVTPHHLGLSVRAGDPNLRHLVNPPLRSENDRQELIRALCDGTADVIATDHAPHTSDDKANGAPGFSGLETAFAVCNTELVKSGLMSASKLSELMSANPAKIMGLDKGAFAKGRILPGFVADLVLCDMGKPWIVMGCEFRSKGKYTPLEGKSLYGKVLKVFHRGECVFTDSFPM